MPGIRIKNGKGGEGGGGAGGKGESELERLWHAVLRSPNPSTIRTFKELFDVADPSQTLFAGGAMAGTGTTKASSQMNNALLRHLSKLETQIKAGATTARSRRSIENTHAKVRALHDLAASGALPGVGVDASTAALLSQAEKRKVGYDIIYAKKQAEIQQAQRQKAYDRTQPWYAASRAREGVLGGAIGGAEGAIMMGSLGEFRKYYRVLDKLEKNSAKQLDTLRSIKGIDEKELAAAQATHQRIQSAKARYQAVGRARWGRRATSSGIGGVLKDAVGASLLGDIMDPLAVGATVALAGATAVWKSVDMEKHLVAAMQPYTSVRLGSSMLARMLGGSNGAGVFRTLYGTPGGARWTGPAWEKKYGLTRADVIGAMNSAGEGGYSLSKQIGFVKTIAKYNQTGVGLAGLGMKPVEQLALLGANIGITQFTKSSQTLKLFQEAVAAGTATGVNRATDIHVLSSSLQSLASGGSLNRGRFTTAMISGLLGSGITSMRTGAGEASALQASNKVFGNLMGHSAWMTSAYMGLEKMTHGGPLTNKDLRTVLGAHRFNAMMKSSVGYKTLQDLKDAWNSGYKALAVQNLGPYISNRERFSLEQPLRGMTPGVLRPFVTPGGPAAYNSMALAARISKEYPHLGKWYKKHYGSYQIGKLFNHGKQGITTGEYQDMLAASKKYGIPVGVLIANYIGENGASQNFAGIAADSDSWGLFGAPKSMEKNPASFRQAAFASAKIMSRLMRIHRGNLGEAFSAYTGLPVGSSGVLDRVGITEAYNRMIPVGSSTLAAGKTAEAIRGLTTATNTAEITRAKTLYKTTHGLVLTLEGLSTNAVGAAQALKGFTDALNDTIKSIEKKPSQRTPPHYVSRMDTLNPWAGGPPA
ncbi:hypothetical protein [Candidatus Igneacidithiobacillus taiwanensis]|uniref:hypothetical protein n=1 Tax=Candidatus Igneacidithiobacillus taiwanensis TaxID=1945924 RepID=UPI0028A12C18|nr:hypothetical protein [Candidatus Igneacidithiobacillus taiwanensis]